MDKEQKIIWNTMRKEKMQQLAFEILQGYYKIYIQPKIDVSNGKIYGAEVLIRYQKNDEIITPDAFIHELEQFKIIHLLDIYVFELACFYLHKWKSLGYEKICLACNFSRCTLQEKKIVEKLNRIRNQYSIDAKFLEIEITETTQINNDELYVSVGKQLQSFGYNLTLDDFGSGYSNFIFVASLPFTCLKLDKDTIQELDHGTRMNTLLENMIHTSHEMGMKVVAEGIETKAQMDILKRMRCDYLQGYLIDKPMPVLDFEKNYINNSKTRTLAM